MNFCKKKKNELKWIRILIEIKKSNGILLQLEGQLMI